MKLTFLVLLTEIINVEQFKELC